MRALVYPFVLLATLLGAFPTNAGQVSRLANVYYEDIFGGKVCNNTNFCQNSSSATPSDNYTEIKHVYCRLTSANSQLVTLDLQVYVSPPVAGNGQSPLRSLPLSIPQPQFVQGTSTYWYNLDQDVVFLVGQSRYVAFSATNAGLLTTTTMTCGFTGDMVPPPP
jgi:hypothetical protein